MRAPSFCRDVLYSRAVTDIDLENNERLQAVLSKLLQHKLSKSLELLDESLRQWRKGDLSVFEAHAEVLQHAARAERVAGKVASAGENAPALVRDAFDLGIVARDEFVALLGVEPDQIEPSKGMDDGLSMPLKRDLVTQLLMQGPVLVHVDAGHESVSVPEHLAGDAKLVLRFGYDLRPRIPDLSVETDALSGTLTFNGAPFMCVLPWAAVYAVVSEVDERGMVWPEDLPKAVLQEMASQAQMPSAGPTPAMLGEIEESVKKPAKRRASHLKLVD